MTITEFCDKGKIGFLSGDLSKDLMHFLFHHLSYIETQKLSDNSQIYTKLEEFLC